MNSDKQKKDLIDYFSQLEPVNRKDVLNHARTVFVAQENTKKALEEQGEGKESA